MATVWNNLKLLKIETSFHDKFVKLRTTSLSILFWHEFIVLKIKKEKFIYIQSIEFNQNKKN